MTASDITLTKILHLWVLDEGSVPKLTYWLLLRRTESSTEYFTEYIVVLFVTGDSKALNIRPIRLTGASTQHLNQARNNDE